MSKISKDRKTKTVVRKKKNKDNPWVTINKSVFDDTSISLEAKGLMGIFLSKPDNWKIIMENISSLSKNGRDAHYRVLKELREHGYLVLVEFRIKGKIAQKEYVIYEEPIDNPNWNEPLIISVNSQKDIDNWDDDYTESLINKEVSPYPEIQDQAIEPHPEKPDQANPDQVKPDEDIPTLLNNEITNNEFKNKISKVLLTSKDVVVVYQNVVEHLFEKKITKKHIEHLIQLAKQENKDLMLCIENTYNYHVSVEPRNNPYGAIKHAIESSGWVIPEKEPAIKSVKTTNKTANKADKLPKSVAKQMEEQKQPEQPQKQEMSNEEYEEKQARLQAKIKNMPEVFKSKRNTVCN